MITVYYYETEYGKWIWDEVFLELVLWLKENRDATVVHKKGDITKMIPQFLHVDDLNFDLPNCVLLIRDSETGALTGITFEDNPGEVVNMFIRRNRHDDKLLIFQYANKWMSTFKPSEYYNFKILQGVHYPHYPIINHDYFYNERRLHKLLGHEFIDKMFWIGREDRGTIWDLRKLGLVPEVIIGNNQEQYMDHLIKYKMGIGVAGVGEMCCREFECMSAGVPVIRVEFTNQLNPPLIPNFHYISIDRAKYGLIEDVHLDQRGTPQHTQGYIDRFNEVKDDKDFLDFIGKNGREYYEKYCHPCTRLNHLLNILNL